MKSVFFGAGEGLSIFKQSLNYQANFKMNLLNLPFCCR